MAYFESHDTARPDSLLKWVRKKFYLCTCSTSIKNGCYFLHVGQHIWRFCGELCGPLRRTPAEMLEDSVSCTSSQTFEHVVHSGCVYWDTELRKDPKHAVHPLTKKAQGGGQCLHFLLGEASCSSPTGKHRVRCPEVPYCPNTLTSPFSNSKYLELSGQDQPYMCFSVAQHIWTSYVLSA